MSVSLCSMRYECHMLKWNAMFRETMSDFIMHGKWTKRLRKRKKLLFTIFLIILIFSILDIFLLIFLSLFIIGKHDMCTVYVQKRKKENNQVTTVQTNARKFRSVLSCVLTSGNFYRKGWHGSTLGWFPKFINGTGKDTF